MSAASTGCGAATGQRHTRFPGASQSRLGALGKQGKNEPHPCWGGASICGRAGGDHGSESHEVDVEARTPAIFSRRQGLLSAGGESTESKFNEPLPAGRGIQKSPRWPHPRPWGGVETDEAVRGGWRPVCSPAAWVGGTCEHPGAREEAGVRQRQSLRVSFGSWLLRVIVDLCERRADVKDQGSFLGRQLREPPPPPPKTSSLVALCSWCGRRAGTPVLGRAAGLIPSPRDRLGCVGERFWVQSTWANRVLETQSHTRWDMAQSGKETVADLLRSHRRSETSGHPAWESHPAS